MEQHGSSEQAQLDALREELSALAGQARGYVNETADAIAHTARDGTAGTVRTIRRNPGLAMAVAAGAGAALGLLVTQRSRSPYERLSGRLPDIGGYSLSGLTSSIERAIDRAHPRESLTSVGGRIAHAVGDSGVQDGLSKAAEKALDWWDTAKKRVADKAKDLK